MAEPDCVDIMVAGPGSHLVMPDYTSPDKMGFLWFTEDGRVLYLLPWEGSTLAGTTDAKVRQIYLFLCVCVCVNTSPDKMGFLCVCQDTSKEIHPCGNHKLDRVC